MRSIISNAAFAAHVTCALGAMTSSLSAGSPGFTEKAIPLGIDFTQIPAPALGFSLVPVSPMLGAGAAGDFDNDGWQDLFLLSGGSAPDRLYMNTGGAFIDAAAAWNVAAQHIGIGVGVGDIDNDGLLDMFVVSWGESVGFQLPVNNSHRLYLNSGTGTFVESARSAGVNQLGTGTIPAGWNPSFGDYDLDGDLDLAIPSWTAGGLFLFRNNLREGMPRTFTDVTVASGVHSDQTRGFSAAFADLDGDRYPELLVAADFGTSRYYRNNRDGTFTDITSDCGTGIDGNGMGHAIGDLDGDTLLDWYVTSIYSLDSGFANVPGTGNMLYRCLGPHTFVVPEDLALLDGGWGWGTEIVDVDHDGRLDVVETNGWPMVNGHGQPEWMNEPSYLWRNLGGLKFEELALASGLVHTGQGRGLIRMDIDNDGDQDIVILGYLERVHVYENTLQHGPATSWTRLLFDTSANPKLAPDGFGVQVLVSAGGRTQRAVLHGGATFSAQSELSIHLGLGKASSIDELRIEWPDLTVTRMRNVPVNQTLRIESGVRSDLTGDGVVGLSDLLRILAAWGPVAGDSDEPADLDGSGHVDMMDVLALFHNWSS